MNFHSIATTAANYAMFSALLLAVGLLAPKLIRLRHPSVLLAYWRWLLLVVVLLPLAAIVWQPSPSAPTLRLQAVSVEEVVATALPTTIAPARLWVLAVVLATVILLALVRLLVGYLYLRRCRRQALPLEPLPSRVSSLQHRLGVSPPILVSERLRSPLTFGWLRPAVIVPSAFSALTDDQQEGVACHELLHVRRRDWMQTVVEEIVRALLWFHPAVWLLLPRIALSREQVVDADTVRVTGKRRQYLDGLWSVIRNQPRESGLLAMPLLGRSHLFERVELLRKESSMSKTRIVVSVAVLVASIGLTGALGASVFSTGGTESIDDGAQASAKKKQPPSDSPLRLKESDSTCEDIVHPKPTSKVQPVYPETARQEKVVGLVLLETIISDTGEVEGITVVDSPDERLSEAAKTAVEQWTFEPALCEGQPVGVYFNVTIKFALK
ncbi:MAG: M56 family metallopeptidase [Holophagae bacterium]|jgi:TonB family protein